MNMMPIVLQLQDDRGVSLNLKSIVHISTLTAWKGAITALRLREF